MAEDNPKTHPRIPRAAARAIALPLRWPAPSRRGAELGGFLARQWEREVEQRRLFPWIAVCFGLGILLFFAADGEPALWSPVGGALSCASAAFAMRRRPASMVGMIAMAAIFAGFAAGIVRTRNVAAPVLARTVIANLQGQIESVEHRPPGARLTIQVTSLDRFPAAERPRRVRVTVRDATGLAAGQGIAGTARLLPPVQPAWPGGYDFARDAFFREIGGVGSFVGAITKPDLPPGGLGLGFAAPIDLARNALTHRIAEASGGQPGAVAAALVTGKRGLIEEPTNDALRAAGIYHIVSISGLHMVLAAGTIFWLVRALLALSPAVALLWPVKKIAALAAMAGAVGYCIFSGSEVATERSLIMTLVMFGAMLVDRPALSMRNLSIAALIVLAREPETLVGPSFQMSFGAVAALIALSPLLHPKVQEGAPVTLLDRAWRWAVRALVGLVAMTLVASLATAPFATYHFQTLNPFGLIGNGLALPLVSLVVMPAALLGVLAYPFGLDRPVWQVMGLAVEKVLQLSEWVGAFEGANVVVPAPGVAALACCAGALLIATLPVSAIRWLALLPAGAGLAFAATPERYDLFVDREGAGAAVRNAAGRLVIVGRPSGFVVEQWLRADGDGRATDDASLRKGASCDPKGCVVTTARGLNVSYVTELVALEEDCRRAAIIVTRLDAQGCGAGLVLDRSALRARGATVVRFEETGFVTWSTRRAGEPRPWADRTSSPPTAVPTNNRPRPARPTFDSFELDDNLSIGEPG
jgi:competence protein ComEC